MLIETATLFLLPIIKTVIKQVYKSNLEVRLLLAAGWVD